MKPGNRKRWAWFVTSENVTEVWLSKRRAELRAREIGGSASRVPLKYGSSA